MHTSMSSSVNDKSDSEDFDEDDGEESAEDAEALDVDHLIRNLDRLKRRGAKLSDPAWRRLERYREDKHTEELLSDFDDFDLDDDLERDIEGASGSHGDDFAEGDGEDTRNGNIDGILGGESTHGAGSHARSHNHGAAGKMSAGSGTRAGHNKRKR